MSSIDEILAARRASQIRPVSITVLLDADQSDRIDEIEADLRSLAESTDQRLAMPDGSGELQAELDAIRAESASALVTFQFEKLPGDMWIDLISRNPPRAESVLDMNYFYNLDAVTMAAAKAERGGHHFAWQLDGDKPVVLTDEQWDEIFSLLSGHDMSSVRDAIWNVNEWQPAQRLEAAKKALAGTGTGSN